MGYWGDPFTQPKRYRTNVEIHLLLERKAIDHLSKQSKAPSAVLPWLQVTFWVTTFCTSPYL
jgi:hypothetical protein